jgi:hypothetical protein
MKKLYILLLTTVICLQAIAQSHTVIIYASGVAGSGKTGSCNPALIAEGSMTVTATPVAERAFAVFDLSSLPADANIVSATVGMDVVSLTGVGGGMPTFTTYGVTGDLFSTYTTAGTMYPAMITSPAVVINNTVWGGSVGHKRLPVNATGITSLQGSLGTMYSVSFTSTTLRLYGLTGETGTTDTSTTHAPFIAIKYTCASLTSISATATPSTLCDGSATTLVGSAAGGDSYVWSFPGGTSSPSNIATHTVSGSGVYTFTATSATGCSVDSMINVTGLPAPAPVITASGSTVLCIGTTVTLNGTTTGGVSYQWFDAGIPVAGATNATYEATNTGNLTVEVTNGSGCSGTSANTGVLLLNTPSLTPAGAANLCVSSSSSSVLLSVGTGGVTSGVDFQWQKDGVDIPGATNSTHAATTSGAYYVIVSASGGGCSTTSDTTHVSIASSPNPFVNYSGGMVSTSGTYVAYQWFLNSTAIPGATSATYVPTTNGSYRVRVTNSTGCTNFSSPVMIGNVGVGQISKETVKVYPNPALNTIKVDAPVSPAVVVTSITGKTMISGKTNEVMNIDQLAPGIYFVVIYDEQGERVTTEKLVKE